jgi:hypothetical protein
MSLYKVFEGVARKTVSSSAVEVSSDALGDGY